jgi:hypothetical protein
MEGRQIMTIDQPWHGKHPLDLDTSTLALLLEAIAADAERAPDRTISAVGLADILLAASDRLLESP